MRRVGGTKSGRGEPTPDDAVGFGRPFTASARRRTLSLSLCQVRTRSGNFVSADALIESRKFGEQETGTKAGRAPFAIRSRCACQAVSFPFSSAHRSLDTALVYSFIRFVVMPSEVKSSFSSLLLLGVGEIQTNNNTLS